MKIPLKVFILLCVLTIDSHGLSKFKYGPYGINNWVWDNDEINKAFYSAGMRFMRVVVNWPTAEPEDDNFQWDRTRMMGTSLDVALEKFKKYGFLVNIAIWDETPEWAKTDPERKLSYRPEEMEEFIYEMLKYCERIAPGMVFSVEWNELPLLAWNDKIPVTCGTDQRDPSIYFVKILEHAHRAVKRFNSEYNRDVLMTMDSIWQQGFHHLDELYQLGMKDYFDRINLHYYTEDIRGVSRELPPTVENIFHFPTTLLYLKYIANKWGDFDKNIWVTEFGWRHVGEKSKADYNEYVMEISMKSGFVELVQPYVGSDGGKYDDVDKISLVYDTTDKGMIYTESYERYKNFTKKYPVWDEKVTGEIKPIPPAEKDVDIINCDFETGKKKGWNGFFKIVSDVSYSGKYSACVSEDGGFIETKYSPVEKKRLYEITAKIKVSAEKYDNAMVSIFVNYITETGFVETIPQNYYGIVKTDNYPGGWRGIVLPEISLPDAREVSIKFVLSGKGKFWLDDLAMKRLDLTNIVK